MTARLRAAAHWSPFDGLYATATTTIIAAGVGLIGYATAPHPGAQR